MDITPTIAVPPEVRYPRAADQNPTPENDADRRPRWIAALLDSLGLIAVIWSIPVAILIVALPIALIVAMVTWFAR